MKKLSKVAAGLLALSLSGCYLPATANWYDYAGTFCGRKTLYERACSAGFWLVTSPVQVGALVIDIPFSMIEFFVGWAPFDQEWIKTGALPAVHPEPFVDADGNLWEVKPDPLQADHLLLTKARDGVVVDSYWVRRVDGRRIAFSRATCDDYTNPATCDRPTQLIR
jgi:hypothetical protein